MVCHKTGHPVCNCNNIKSMKNAHTIVSKHLELSKEGSLDNDSWWHENYSHLKCMYDMMQKDVEFIDAHNACNQQGHVFDDFKR